MSTDDREARVRNFVEEVWNMGNYEAASDLYAETYVKWFRHWASGPG